MLHSNTASLMPAKTFLCFLKLRPIQLKFAFNQFHTKKIFLLNTFYFKIIYLVNSLSFEHQKKLKICTHLTRFSEMCSFWVCVLVKFQSNLRNAVLQKIGLKKAVMSSSLPHAGRDSGNNFCQISVLGYPTWIRLGSQLYPKKRPETTVVLCRICQQRLETKLLLVESAPS